MSESQVGLWIKQLKLVAVGEGLYAGVVNIDRQIAAALLRINTNNRAKKPTAIARYGVDMLAKKWVLTGESIIISNSNRLLNGQNRIQACLNTGASFTSLVVVGVENEAMDNQDSGVSRKVADALTLHGEKSTLALAATCSWIIRYRSDNMLNSNRRPTVSQTRDLLDAEPGIRTHLVWSRSKLKSPAGGNSLYAALRHLTFCGEMKEFAEDFWERLADGIGLGVDSPILLLRNSLSRMAGPRKPAPSAIAAYVIKAWNSYVEAAPLKQLKFSAGETFPTLAGLAPPVKDAA